EGAELQELVVDGAVPPLEKAEREGAGGLFGQRVLPEGGPAAGEAGQVDEVEALAGPEAGQVAADAVGGEFALEGEEPFQGEDGVVEVALPGPVAGPSVVVELVVQEAGDGFSGLLQELGRQPRDLQHFEPQTHRSI